MVIMTHNTDIADGWEREAEEEEYFYRFSLKALSGWREHRDLRDDALARLPHFDPGRRSFAPPLTLLGEDLDLAAFG